MQIPLNHLPGGIATQTERAIETIRYAEQQGRLQQLAQLVHQVATAATDSR
jgi:hypothetical protein